ncbi:hypothetical protein [Streptococcus devriesei]|uniref:hypothetical protein n=1 Tax=Streptococcus devriesei TaxID=231233 RepID=UPI00048014E0|nr:hypothetical protein [Streptococcus devriesei]
MAIRKISLPKEGGTVNSKFLTEFAPVLFFCCQFNPAKSAAVPIFSLKMPGCKALFGFFFMTEKGCSEKLKFKDQESANNLWFSLTNTENRNKLNK